MELKNAVTVCLITLFSATLVLLIARALDSQAASRLEPQLAMIAEELEAIRNSGGIRAVPGVATTNEAVDDALMVYYLHGNIRCVTCRSIEEQAHKTIESEFDARVESGDVAWKVVNYEEPAGAELGKKFEVQMPVVVLARMNGGQIENWKRLDKVWALVGDKPAFSEYIRDEVNRMLATAKEGPTLAPIQDASDAPLPVPALADIPIPSGAIDIRVPR